MKTYSSIALAALAFTALATPTFAQTSAADPACMIKNADGSESIDKTKCPDGLKPVAPGAASDAAPAVDSTASKSTTAAPDASTQDPAAAPDSTASTTPAPVESNYIIVPAERLANAKIMTASDFIGKRVYTKAGEDIGEVNDLIVSDNGSVQAVILGVGGLLGLGEKDVAVTMQSIEMQADGSTAKLVVDASKDQLTNAPGYDRVKRTYLN